MRKAGKQEKKYKIDVLLLLLLVLMPFFVKAQADLRTDNYIQINNHWEDSIKLKKIKVQSLPLLLKYQYVQDHPYNWNDGAMIPAKGLQQLVRVGAHAQWKFIELQLAPEMVTAQNQYFDQFPLDLAQVHWKDYYRFYNFIELPQRMGENQYAKFLPGQSFIKFHYKKLSLGVSTENKWWGPSQRNSLLLSNTGAGFPHITIANQSPLETKIGNFNFEAISGTLTNGGWPPPESYKTFNGNLMYVPKPNETRIINGFTLQYQPKWTKHLTVGVAQMYMQYQKNMSYWQDYLPIKNIVSRFNSNRVEAPIILSEFNFKYTMPEAGAEIYGELGWNLHQTTFRNWIIQPDKGFASILGIKKTFATKRKYYWELLGEITQLQLLTRAEQFTKGVPPSWYLGSNVRQGYTNDGQLLGAGVGPGGSAQFVEFNWRKNKNRVGLAVERREHNSDFYEYTFEGSQDFRRFYVDFATTLKIDWKYKKFTIAPRISYIKTNNYNWMLFQPQDIYFITGKDIHQWVGQLNLQYQF